MILNTDDMKYLLKKFGWWAYPYNVIGDFNTSEEFWPDVSRNSMIYAICMNILLSRCVDVEQYFLKNYSDPRMSFHYSDITIKIKGIPELEEDIRRSVYYRAWYEELAGLKI